MGIGHNAIPTPSTLITDMDLVNRLHLIVAPPLILNISPTHGSTTLGWGGLRVG